jgi:putative flavoprotein involved in K+ transport
MHEFVGRLISPDVEANVGPCWGLGSGAQGDPGPWEGELRNMWKPTAQEGLWFHGGNLAQSRLYSLHLALQLKARLEGLPVKVHRTAPIVRPPRV